jgi:hypothetical protein
LLRFNLLSNLGSTFKICIFKWPMRQCHKTSSLLLQVATFATSLAITTTLN